ncbi:DUF1707 SHOCT-like domain-containing protein [Nocardioides ganghwensis]|jgi:hypothetical protein|uniref:DUF1707 domain-containing protein n=1 Tax=Nocardioides ganghwensis TaxID=252230 RepID=A0A4Q2SDA7_9ACTN|nr:DUF1707 domain-containing protein [Nocardioides ganghwensis]MBD3947244.1 DUF1707 domain-containing protein [Nocardioides ganghwensis]RYC00745.1 DUF1707 domain-containing protein [Nocardioides ganghwensis]
MTTPSGATPGSGPGDEAMRMWMAARDRAEAAREATLASDAERERVCDLLNRAFSQGRLTPADLDERTSRALTARTHGDLEDVLAGLTPTGTSALWAQRPQRGFLPRLVFWIVGLLTSPFVLGGSLFVLFGEGVGERVFGIVLLVVFLPGLIALYRWAHPRH